MIHSIRHTKKKKGFMALKIDLKKAYDRVHWEFVIDCLIELGVDTRFKDIIECCLSKAKKQIL